MADTEIVVGVTRRASPASPAVQTGKKRTIRFVATTEKPDEYNTIIKSDGWDLENRFWRNPVFLWAHDSRSLPPGKVVAWEPTVLKLGEKNYGANHADVEFPDRRTYPFGFLIYELYRKDFLRAVSVGFETTKSTRIEDLEELEKLGLRPPIGEILEKNILVELSAVPLPGNVDALKSELGAFASSIRMAAPSIPEMPGDGFLISEWLGEILGKLKTEIDGAGGGAIVSVERAVSEFGCERAKLEEWCRALRVEEPSIGEIHASAIHAWKTGKTDEEKRAGFT